MAPALPRLRTRTTATPAGPTGTASSSSATRAATASPTPTAEVVVGEARAESTAVALPDLWEPDLSVRAFEAPTTGLPGLHGVLAAREDSPLVDEAVEELSGGVTGTGEDGQETSTGGPNAVRPHRVLLVCEDPDAGPSSIGYLDPEDLEYVPVAWSEGCGGFSGEIPDAAEGGADTVVTVDVPAWVRYSTAEIRER